jgi:small ligand-binding sensory domain FIST
MFCAGEIGPVGERNFLHGHTASIAIVRAGPVQGH